MKGKRFFQLSSVVLAFLIVMMNFSSLTSAYAQNNEKGSMGQVPHLLITEVVASSTDAANGQDGYEFFELHNTTDQVINLKDYTINYRYPNYPYKKDIVWSLPDAEIQPNDTLVLWKRNGKKKELTLADFNANYRTDLIEGKDIIEIDSGTMADNRQRSVVLATNTGQEIAIATYNNGQLDVVENKGIQYKYPTDGSNNMDKIGTKSATPGTVDPVQVPENPIHAGEDHAAPMINNLTEAAQVHPAEGIEIVADAKDNRLVKTFTLYYKTNTREEFTKVNLTQSRNDSLYHYTIDDNLLLLVQSDSVQYYFVASDGNNQTTSETYNIQFRQNSESPRLNVEDGELLSGKTFINATANQVQSENLNLSIDGKEVQNTFSALEETAYFVFEASGMNGGAADAVTVNKKILQIVHGISGYDTVTIPVEPIDIHKGNGTIAIRAGNGSQPYFKETFPSDKFTDDFNVRNVRLVLADGTVVRDPQYSDPGQRIHIGDSTSRVVYLSFDIPPEKLTSKAFEWDTTSVLDGNHVIRVVTPKGDEASSGVMVDNHGPSIETTLEEGKQYKGEFTIDVTATDEATGVKNVEVKLDGQKIEVPYNTSSAALAAGEHILKITATDKIGNQSTKKFEFAVVAEDPMKPELVSPKDGATGVGGDPTLNVKVNDPTNDDMNVTFYQGHRYNVKNKDGVTAFTGATNSAPAQKRVPDGDAKLTQKQYSKILSSDDNLFATNSTKKFPYLRLEINVDRQLNKNDTVQIHWEGTSLAGRRVTMMAWNYNEHAWNVIDKSYAEGNKALKLTANVNVEDYVRNHKVNVMIQDQDHIDVKFQTSKKNENTLQAQNKKNDNTLQAQSKKYDYTYVWMSDTQFYTEVYPGIFKSEVNWIKNNADNMNIDYVFHTGDIVNVKFLEYQWELADRLMGVLDENQIPYGVLAGNHDVIWGGADNTPDYSIYSQYFGVDRFKDKPYYGGSYKDNRGHYDLISVDGNDYIMVYMGWGIGDEQIAWMNKILAEYPNRKAILNFHRYLRPNGRRSGIGETIYNEVVVPNKNVIAVLSGHYTGSAKLVSSIDDDGDSNPDRNVYQLLSDYQGYELGGAGYMKLLRFNTDKNQVFVTTYSPYLDDYNYFDPAQYPGKDQYTISLNLEPVEKKIATDYVEVNVYNHKKIGTVNHVESGQNAKVQWHGLEEGQTYYWYVRVEDNYGGHKMSDLWSFTTSGDDDDGEDSNDGDKDEEEENGEEY